MRSATQCTCVFELKKRGSHFAARAPSTFCLSFCRSFRFRTRVRVRESMKSREGEKARDSKAGAAISSNAGATIARAIRSSALSFLLSFSFLFSSYASARRRVGFLGRTLQSMLRRFVDSVNQLTVAISLQSAHQRVSRQSSDDGYSRQTQSKWRC